MCLDLFSEETPCGSILVSFAFWVVANGGSTVLSEYQIFASYVVYSLVVKRIEMNCLDIIAVNPITELPGRSLITLFSTCICFIFFVNKMPVNNVDAHW